MQSAEPDTPLYLPGEQLMHCPLSGPLYPAPHLQFSSEVLAVTLIVLAAQAMHFTAAESDWNVFGGHALQDSHPKDDLNFPEMQDVHSPAATDDPLISP